MKFKLYMNFSNLDSKIILQILYRYSLIYYGYKYLWIMDHMNLKVGKLTKEWMTVPKLQGVCIDGFDIWKISL